MIFFFYVGIIRDKEEAMKKTIWILCIAFMISGLYADKSNNQYYWETIATPNKALNFTLILFHQKYKWTESKSEGNYSTLPLYIKNKNTTRQLKWHNYEIYLQFKNDSLVHNYKTVAKTGRFANNYTVEPGKGRYQTLCFAKRFNPDNIKHIFIKMTHANFIKLSFYDKALNPKKSETLEGSAPDPGQNVDPEARSLLMKFLDANADHATLTKALRPSEADYRAYFASNAWQTAMTKYNELWDKYPMAIKPNTGQTQLLLWSATIEDIKYGTGDASKFPGGYKMIHDKIEPGHTIYRFKFVQPGKNIGMAFDGLVKVNGRWVIFPKPWRIFQK